MTLDEMIERLEELRDSYGVSGDSRVSGAFQPNYPLIARISAITAIESEDSVSIYIALDDAREYGTRSMWSDDVIDADEEEEN